MKTAIAILLSCLCCTAIASAQKMEVSAGYVYQGSHTLAGSALSFNGGRTDFAVYLPLHMSAVGEFAGTTANSLNGSPVGTTLLTYMAGPRYRIPLKGSGKKAYPISPFGQFLMGGTRATNGSFPTMLGLMPTATSLAMSAGGGLDIAVGHRVSIRLLQADYLYTRLPNLVNSHQNHYRIGAAIVFRLR